MAPTLRRLLGAPSLELRLLTPALPEDSLDAPVAWVHGTDLVDPTPFVTPGQVLLTTGTQWPEGIEDATASGYDHYVARLVGAEVTAVGFGTEVTRSGTPQGLVDACLAYGLPLFEVPYRVPFIAVARLAADLLAEETYARGTWALEAGRAISLAAMRPDGLGATLAELSTQLDRGVALFDAAGRLDRMYPAGAIASDALEAATAAAGRLLDRGRRASTSVEVDGEPVTLQTLGGRDRLRGVLAIVGGEPDEAARTVVTMVIAMAGLALEQNRELGEARLHLRAGLFVALLGGQHELVDTISRALWGPLAAGPLTLVVTEIAAARVPVLVERLELLAVQRRGALYFAVHEGRVILIGREGDDLTTPLGTASVVGRARLDDWRDLTRAYDRAQRALHHARERGTTVDFEDLAREGVLAWLSSTGDPGIRQLGEARLRAVIDHDAVHRTGLLECLHVWLSHDARLDAAATALGVHRHTVRARLAKAAQLLDCDLDSFADRAELWAALLAIDGGRTASDPRPIA